MKKLLLLLIIFSLSFTGCLVKSPSQGGTIDPGSDDQGLPETQYGSLSGTVIDQDTGIGLWYGTVQVGDKKAEIKSGAFQLENLPVGNYTLKVSKDFYHDATMNVKIDAGKTTVVEVEMKTNVSDSELDLFARLVYSESKGEPYIGQVAVAASVLNRVRHPDYPNSISGVINHVVVANGKKYYQYEPVLNGTIKQPADANAKAAVHDALVGWDPSQGATGFFAYKKVPQTSWVWSRPATVTIADHRFFK